MTQDQLDHAVAHATGETLLTIRKLGFSIADPAVVCHDPEPLCPPRIVNWDRLATQRVGFFPCRSRRHRAR